MTTVAVPVPSISIPLSANATLVVNPPAVQYSIQVSDALATMVAAGYNVVTANTTPVSSSNTSTPSQPVANTSTPVANTTANTTTTPSSSSGASLPAPATLPAGPYSVAGTPDVVFAGGVLNWPVDFTYGGLQHTVVSDPNGSGKKVLQCSTPAGTGGWQPGYQNPPPPYVGTPVLGTTYNTYSTAGKTYLNLDVKITMAGSDFVSSFLAANDSAIAGASEVTIPASQLIVGQWVRLKIPLGAGGYNLPTGQSVLKFNLQENNPMANNVFYFDNVYFD